MKNKLNKPDFDTFIHNNEEFHLKNGNCSFAEFKIGDIVSENGYEDGIYFDVASNGVIVIFQGKFSAAFLSNSLRISDVNNKKLNYNKVVQCLL